MKTTKPTAKTAAKTKPVKARKYWKTKESGQLHTSKVNAQYFGGFAAHTVEPVAVIPCDKASARELALQIAIALTRQSRTEGATMISAARAALASIGITGGAK